MKEFQARFDGLRSDISIGYSSILIADGIYKICLENQKVESMINQQWSFWVRTINCHVSNAIICLGKVFDSDARSQTITSLVNWVEKNQSEFSISSIKGRKFSDGMTESGWNEYAIGIHVFDQRDFLELKEKASEIQKLFNEEVKTARHKIFAHRDSISLEAAKKLLEGLSFDYLEHLFGLTQGIEVAVFQGMANGRKFEFDPERYTNEKETLEHLKWVVDKCMM